MQKPLISAAAEMSGFVLVEAPAPSPGEHKCSGTQPCRLRLRDLRHSYAVASLRSGDDAKTVQENLGHATAAFTLDVYGHVTEQMKTESANRMQAFIQSVSS